MTGVVEVLCLNGHRQKVKTLPSTTLLQVLEECCTKHGFKPVSDYELKHGRKAVDLTLNVRFAGLPNHAKLEMVRAQKSRTESNIILALQLPSGERLQHEFSPTTCVWDVLCHWEKQPNSIHSGKLTRSDTPGHHPVVVYMRDEVLGEYAMRETSLRQLGLTGGKAVFRLIHKAVDEESLANVKVKLDQEKARKMRMLAKASGLEQPVKHAHKVQTTTGPPTLAASDPNLVAKDTGQENIPMDTSSTGNISKSSSSGRSEEPMDADSSGAVSAMVSGTSTGASTGSGARSKTGMDASSSSQNSALDRIANLPGVEVLQPGECVLTPEEQQQAIEYARTIMPGLYPQVMPDPVEPSTSKQPPVPQFQAPVQNQFAEFKFPESTKGKNLYQNELSDSRKEDYMPCEREAVLYSMEDTVRSVPDPAGMDTDDIPDEFFEVTERDVRSMMTELQKKVSGEDDQPLMTSAMRLAAQEAKLSKYDRVVIRFHFPDKIVLQAIFRPRETVHSLQKFVKEHLVDETIKFYLYTTPPKCVLRDPSQTLIEADLVPMTLVYFGCETEREHYLSTTVIQEKSSQEEADRVVVRHMYRSASSQPGPSGSDQSSTSNSKRPSTTSTDQSAGAGKQKLPKWFKVGKK